MRDQVLIQIARVRKTWIKFMKDGMSGKLPNDHLDETNLYRNLEMNIYKAFPFCELFWRDP